jgi:ParB family chromosome partitioning protein
MPLGKSLGNILDDYFGDQEQKTDIATGISSKLQDIDVDKIEISEFQTRRHFEETAIQNLAKNIQDQGLIHPVVVLIKNNKFVLLAGERRLRAVKFLGWKKISALIKTESELPEKQQAMLSAMENLQREDLSALEIAETLAMLLKTQDLEILDLAELIGYSQQYIKNYLRLLSVSDSVKKALLTKKITEGHTRPLINLPKEEQDKMLIEILNKDLTVKEIEKILQSKDKKNKNFTTREFKHAKAFEILNRVEKITSYFPKAKMKCTGDDKQGKIIITWKE